MTYSTWTNPALQFAPKNLNLTLLIVTTPRTSNIIQVKRVLASNHLEGLELGVRYSSRLIRGSRGITVIKDYSSVRNGKTG